MDNLLLSMTRSVWPRSEGPSTGVEILINGRLLREIVLEAEESIRPGDDDSSFSSDLMPLPLAEARATKWADLADDNAAGIWKPIFTCTCGIFGCGGFVARMSRSGETVVWFDFADAYWLAGAFWTGEDEEDFRYKGWRRDAAHRIGPFRFDTEAYESEVRKLDTW